MKHWKQWRTRGFLLAALLPCACDVDMYSESGRLGFLEPKLNGLYVLPFESGGAIASGTRLCPSFAGTYQQRYGQHVESCFDTAIDGPARLDGECVEIEGPGEAVWSLERNVSNCLENVNSDRVVFRSVSLNDVHTEEGFVFERFGTEWGEVLAGAEPPEDWITPGDEPLLVAADVTVSLFAMLRETRTGEELAWGRGGTLVVPDGTVGESAVDFRLSLGEEEQAEAWITVDEVSSAPLLVEGVPVSSLGQLEIVPLCMARNASLGDWWLRALARDPSGRPVRGVPVTWSIEGDGHLEQYYAAANPDYMVIETPADVDEDQIFQTMVEAKLGDQVARVALSWTPSSCEGPEPEKELSGRGCTCTTGDAGGNVGWFPLGLFVVLCSRRRWSRESI